MHITLVDRQLDAQNSCLFTYNTFIVRSKDKLNVLIISHSIRFPFINTV